MTTTNTLITWPALLPEATMTVHSTKSRRNKTGLVKRLSEQIPPDDATIQKLNDLASRPPFCTPHKCKKHEMF
jgi:hypothetical protein